MTKEDALCECDAILLEYAGTDDDLVFTLRGYMEKLVADMYRDGLEIVDRKINDDTFEKWADELDAYYRGNELAKVESDD